MVSGLFLITFFFFHVQDCYVLPRNLDRTKLFYFVFGLIQIWECALNLFILEPVHKHLLDVCHLHGLGAAYLRHIFC